MTLTTGGKKLSWPDRCLSIEKDVLSFTVEGSRIKINAVIESGPGICCAGNGGAPVRKTFTFEPLSEDSLRLWNQRLQTVIDSLGRPRRLFILLNPYVGNRSATKVFLDEVKPLLDDANITTQWKEVAHSLDLLRYDGVLCVSGDGILVEVVNGLLEREDWNSAIKMPIGVIPAGGQGHEVLKHFYDRALTHVSKHKLYLVFFDHLLLGYVYEMHFLKINRLTLRREAYLGKRREP